MSVHMSPSFVRTYARAVRSARPVPCRLVTLGGPRDRRSLEEPAMSTTPFIGPRPVRRAPLLALAVAAGGLLTPITGGAVTAQTIPVAGTRATTAALLDRPARLRVSDVSLADAL